MIQRSFVSLVLIVTLIPSLANADALSDAVPRAVRPFVFSATLAATYIPWKIASHLIEDGFCQDSRIQFCCAGSLCKKVPQNTTDCHHPRTGYLYCSNDTNIEPSVVPLISSNVESDVHMNYAQPFVVSGGILFWVGASYTLHSLVVDVIPFIIFKGIVGSPYFVPALALHAASGFVKL